MWKTQGCKFNIAIDNLIATWPAYSTINKPLLLKPESTKKLAAASESELKKPSSTNKRKAGNMNIKNYYKKNAKQVIDTTLSDTENNILSSSIVLAFENNNTS